MTRASSAALAFACALAFSAAPVAQKPLRGSRPNILFVFSDDHACHAISAYGSRVNQTPNIDRLAEHGLLFRNNFCGNSLCGPSRATILTGKHSHANGFMRNGNVFDGDQTTFAKLLHGVGYQTAIFGKWHLSSDPQGFDKWAVLPGQGEYYNPDFLTASGRQRLEGHATDLTTGMAIEWLEQRDPERPFLLMCQHKAPHRNWLPALEDLALYRDTTIPEPETLFDDYAGRGPMAKAQEMTISSHMFLHYDLLVPPADPDALKGTDTAWRAQQQRMTEAQREAFNAAYAAENDAFLREDPQGDARVRWAYQRYMKNYLRCVNGVDRSVGAMLEWLDAHPDVKQNTIIIYSSDQGFYLGDHGWYDKRWMYEESLHMPLLMAWPEHLREGVEVAALTQNIDFAPTFLDMAGVPVPADMHGRSLVPLLEAKDPAAVAWRDAVYYHYYESHAVHMVPAQYGARTERYKLIRYYEPEWDTWELFDLEQDPQELHSVADDPDYAEIRAQLEQRLVELRAQYGDSTGDLGGHRFPVQAGIARVEPIAGSDDGVAVFANTIGSYLLQTGAPRSGVVTVTTTMRPRDGRQQRNGFVLVSGGDPREDLLRCGVEFGAHRLVIATPGSLRAAAAEELVWDGKAPLEVRCTFDLDAHRVTVRAAGVEVGAPMPKGWQALTAWGYGASNAETEFGGLKFE
ncbi:MAG: sulfatase [Planctomycetes bacterium]|nr:sulfatase [Planctomycetota bacterium]